MADDTENRLKALLLGKREELVDRIVREDGRISRADVAAIDAIQRLSQLNLDDAQKARRQRRVQLIVGIIIALVILTLLLLPLPRTDFILEAETVSAKFKMVDGGPIGPPISVRSLRVQGQEKLYVPMDDAGKSLTVSDPVVDLRADAAEAIQVDFPETSPGTQIEIARFPEDGSVELTLCGIDKPAHVTISGRVTLVGESVHSLAPATPALLLVVPRPASKGSRSPASFGTCGSQSSLRYRFVPDTRQTPTEATPELISNLQIKNLELYSETMSQGGVLQPRSALISGQLRITSVRRDPRLLGRNEYLFLENNAGELQSVSVKPNSLGVLFDGSASGLYVGGRRNRFSIMPTVFEWLQSSSQVSLAWSTGLSAFGLLIGLYGWLRGKK